MWAAASSAQPCAPTFCHTNGSLRLVEQHPDLALPLRHREAEGLAVALAVAIQNPDLVAAGHCPAWDLVAANLVLVVVLALWTLLCLQGDAAHAVRDGQFLPIFFDPDKIAALRLSTLDPAVHKGDLQLELAAAII